MTTEVMLRDIQSCMARLERLGEPYGSGWNDFYNRCAELIRTHGPALVEALRDAERWRKTRNAPIGVPGVPCLAMPEGERSGHYVNGEHADAAIDGMPWPETSHIAIAAIKDLLIPYEIAHNVCGPETEYARGYGDACGDIVKSVNDAIDQARAEGGE